MSKVIIYSHGFGVDQTDRGLFTSIIKQMPEEFEHRLFNYNQFDQNNNIVISPFNFQIKRLQNELKSASDNYDEIYLICHSQGCLITALADISMFTKIKKIIFLAPVDRVDTNRIKKMILHRKGSTCDINGQSRMIRADGSTTIIPAEYWVGLDKIDVPNLYNLLSSKLDLTIISAKQDELLGDTNFEYLTNANWIRVKADHNFNQSADRQLMIDHIKSIVQI